MHASRGQRHWYPAVALLAGCVALKDPVAELPGDASSVPPPGAPEAGPSSSPFTVTHSVPAGETLFGVWGASEHFVVAVGTSRLCYIVQDGVVSRLGGDQVGSDYQGIWGSTKDDIFAVGKTARGGGFVSHFDGTSWTNVFDAPVPLLGVWGFQKNGSYGVLAVGAKGLVYGWHPSSDWQQVLEIPPGPLDTGPNAPILWSISGVDGNDFTITAESRVYHRAPTGISYYDLTTHTDTRFRSVWHSPDSTGSAYFGTNFSGLAWFSAKADALVEMSVLARDESSPAGEKTFVQGVWGTSEKVIGVGDRGLMYAWNTGTATGGRLVSPTDSSLTGVWGSSLDDVWIVGERELILHGSLR